jgi:hypothetical protein
MFKQLTGLSGVLLMTVVLAQAGPVDTKFDDQDEWHLALTASGKEGKTVQLKCHLQRAPKPGEKKNPWPGLAGQPVTLVINWGKPVGTVTYPLGNQTLTTDADGKATFTVPIPPGVTHTKHTGHANYDGIAGAYQVANKAAWIKVTD